MIDEEGLPESAPSPEPSPKPDAPESPPERQREPTLRDHIRSAADRQRDKGTAAKEIKPEISDAARKLALSRQSSEKPVVAKPSEKPQEAAPKETTEEPVAVAKPPPGRLSVKTKAIWDSLPDDAKSDFIKWNTEGEAFASRYNGLHKFAALAEKNGTTIQQAVESYHRLENRLIEDPVGGIREICQRLGISPQQIVEGLSNAVQTQQQLPQTQQTYGPEQMAEYVKEQVRADQAERAISDQIAAFGADPANKYFEDVRSDMIAVLNSGSANSLKEAYSKACKMNDDISELIKSEKQSNQPPNNVAAVARAKAAAKAIGGGPMQTGNEKESKDMNLKETIRSFRNQQLESA